MEVNLPELNRRLKAPTIRTRSGRTSRARVHGPGSPRTRHRGRTRLIQFAGVCMAGLLISAIGVGVYANSLVAGLPPIQAYAKEAATLDLFSDGRLLMGVGVGSLHDATAIMGIDTRRPWARIADYVGAMRRLWTSDISSLLKRQCERKAIKRAVSSGRNPRRIFFTANLRLS